MCSDGKECGRLKLTHLKENLKWAYNFNSYQCHNTMAAAKRMELINEVIALLEANRIESATKTLTKMIHKRPDRAPTAYNLFVGHAMKVDKMEMGDAITKWKSMDAKAKAKWVKLAEEKKAELEAHKSSADSSDTDEQPKNKTKKSNKKIG